VYLEDSLGNEHSEYIALLHLENAVHMGFDSGRTICDSQESVVGRVKTKEYRMLT
jgi:hypothetical protein